MLSSKTGTLKPFRCPGRRLAYSRLPSRTNDSRLVRSRWFELTRDDIPRARDTGAEYSVFEARGFSKSILCTSLSSAPVLRLTPDSNANTVSFARNKVSTKGPEPGGGGGRANEPIKQSAGRAVHLPPAIRAAGPFWGPGSGEWAAQQGISVLAVTAL